MNRVPCSGCSLLCDDIIVKSDGLYIEEVIGACIKGKERFDQVVSKNRLLNPLIRDNGILVKAKFDKALNTAANIIKNSSKPLCYGFSTVSCEAQLKGIELARVTNGFIDSNSIICQGEVINTAKQTGITLTTISEVINKGDLLIFWGANVAESIPRLLNKALFSRGKFRMTGREIKTLVLIDPIKTASFGVMGVRDLALQIEPGKDIDLIHVLKEECCSMDTFPSEGVAGIDKDDRHCRENAARGYSGRTGCPARGGSDCRGYALGRSLAFRRRAAGRETAPLSLRGVPRTLRGPGNLPPGQGLPVSIPGPHSLGPSAVAAFAGRWRGDGRLQQVVRHERP